MRGRLLLAVLAGVLALPAAAAADPMPLGLACAPLKSVRFCPGDGASQRVLTFDGVPLDADVTLPGGGSDGPFPTIVMLHGWGGNKSAFETIGTNDGPQGRDGQANHQIYHYNNIWFAQHGYAVVNYTARGFGNSCGTTTSRTPDCQQQLQNGGDQSATGWIHLKDRRREAHDTQFLLGKLVDQGIADPDALAATGISYGGGESIELAYLNDKTQMPDGGFVPWTSPEKKTPLSLAAAWPRWPWSDLVSALLPNGRFLDFDNSTAGLSRAPIGIPIQSYIAGLYALGNTSGWIAPPGADPNADLTTWNARVASGEPTDDAQTTQIAAQIHDFHQGFGCKGCGTPAPMLLQSGWTDDLFPPAETLRVYNSLRDSNPNADVALQYGDLGHSRGSNKTNADDVFNDQGTAFFDKHLRGMAGGPGPGSVTAFSQTCPQDAPAGGPFRAGTWPALHPGAVRFSSAAAQDVTSTGGNPQTGQTLDPISGGSDACATVMNEHADGTAVIDGPKTGGYTLMGLPTVQAKVAISGDYAQLDSRLWDVGADGNRVLISRGAYRLTNDQSGKRIVFQLHGNGWHFAPGHGPQLELLGRDAPYLRPSNTTFSVSVSDVTVELPTLEKPGTGPVLAPTLSRNPKKRLKVTGKPRRTRAGKRTRFTFRVRVGKKNIRGARVRFAGRSHKTGKRGVVRFKARFKKAGKRHAVATKRGFRSGQMTVRVTRKHPRANRAVLDRVRFRL